MHLNEKRNIAEVVWGKKCRTESERILFVLIVYRKNICEYILKLSVLMTSDKQY